MSDQSSPLEGLAKMQQALQESVANLLPNAEQEYFDAVVHMSVGPYVAKLSFGRQNPLDNSILSIKTITLPTAVLTDLAMNIARGFATPGAIEQLAAGQAPFFANAEILREQAS